MPAVLEQPELIETEDQEMFVLSYFAERLRHKLRNPLNAIVTTAHQLKTTTGTVPEAFSASLSQTLLAAANSLEDTLNAFMQYAKSPNVDRELVDVNGICRAEMKYIAYDFSDIEYELDLSEDMPEVECDPGQIRTVLGHLLRNGFQSLADSHPGGTVKLTTGVAGGRAVIEIADTGKGILPEELLGIFKPFQSNRPGRIGLGLAIARKLVRLNHGHISIDSNPGEGTRVILELPFKVIQE